MQEKQHKNKHQHVETQTQLKKNVPFSPPTWVSFFLLKVQCGGLRGIHWQELYPVHNHRLNLRISNKKERFTSTDGSVLFENLPCCPAMFLGLPRMDKPSTGWLFVVRQPRGVQLVVICNCTSRCHNILLSGSESTLHNINLRHDTLCSDCTVNQHDWKSLWAEVYP